MTTWMRNPHAQYAAGTVLLVAAVASGLSWFGRDVRFCRDVLTDLARGRQSAQARIDWDRLKALDVDVGATYAKLPNEQEKRQYRQAFIANFATGFSQSGARLDGFANWRVQSDQAGDRVVAADYKPKQKTLLFRISGAWRKRLEAMQWE